MKIRCMYIENEIIVELLRKLGLPSDVKIFTGRENWLCTDNSERELKPTWRGEKIYYLFMSAENLHKYFDHHTYHLDLKKVVEKFGDKNTKIFILSGFEECNSFVRRYYRDLSFEFIDHDHWDKMADDIMKILNR
jgi:hypothetical protein